MTSQPSTHSYVPRGSGRLNDVGLEIPGYRVQREIGSGGMGVVYQGIDLERRRVAIKILRSHIAHDPLSRERLAREVAALSKVRHRGVARILDAELDDDHAFLVTEYVDGPTLDQVVRKCGPLHPRVVIEIGVLMAETLQEIHRAEIIHRDLKPSNVMLDAVDEAALLRWDQNDEQVSPVIIDFGLAHAKSESRLTATGLVMGTAAYIDPEVILGSEPSAIADWWSWAATLAYIATGSAPFGTAAADVMIARVRSERPKVQDLPPQLRDFFMAVFKPDEKDRPSPSEMIKWLRNVDPDAREITAPTAPPRGIAAARPATTRTTTQAMYPIGPQSPHLPPVSVRTGPVGAVPISGPNSGHDSSHNSGPITDATRRVTGPMPSVGSETPSGGVRRYPEPPTDYLNFRNQPEPRRVQSKPVNSDVTAGQGGSPAAGKGANSARSTPHVGGAISGVSGGSGSESNPPTSHLPQGAERAPHPGFGLKRLVLPLGIATLCLTAAVVPVVACIVAWFAAVIMFSVAFNRRLLERRRTESGPRRSDAWVAGLASPWHGIKALFVALGISLIPVAAGAGVASALYWGLDAAGTKLPGALCCGVGMVVASAVAWRGLKREDLHLGTYRVLASLNRRERGAQIVTIAFGVIAAAAIVAAFTTGGTADLWPFSLKLQ